jgi:SPP1 family predicted phage head-tail adaptor
MATTISNRGQQRRVSRYKHKDKRITIYVRTSEKSLNGYPISAYTPIHKGKLWAYVRQTSGGEYFAAMALNVKEEMLFVVNWRADLNLAAAQSYFIEYKGAWYDIQRVDTYEGYKEDIQLFANSMKTPNVNELRPYIPEF